MPNFYCCVRGCNNINRNNPADFKLCYIPKGPELRQKYVALLRNETVKIESLTTPVCADHWKGREKLSHTHLPTLLPWFVSKAERTTEKIDRVVINQFKTKRKVKDDDDEAINEIESTDCNTSEEEN